MTSAQDRRPSPLDALGAPRWAVIGGALALVAAIVLSVLAWSAIRTPNARAELVKSGSYSYRLDADYRASAPVSAVYPSGGVGTFFNADGARVAAGPLYTRLLDSLHIDVTVDLHRRGSAKDVKARVGGRITIRTPEGWSTIVADVTRPATAHTVVPFDIPLVPLRAQVAEIGAQTGVGGTTFSITLDAAVTIDPGSGGAKGASAGTVDVGRLPVKFAVTQDVIDASPIAAVTADGVLGPKIAQATSMSALGIPVRVDAARVIFPGLALVAIGATVLFALVLFGGLGLSGSDRIAARYRARIVDVAMVTTPSGPVVLVSSVAELARVARAEQSVILHEEIADGSHRYRVVLGAVTYEYQTVPEHAGHASDLVAEDEG